MKQIKTSELAGMALDYCVAQIEHKGHFVADWHMYSSDWSQGGPIVEREKIQIQYCWQLGNPRGLYIYCTTKGRDYSQYAGYWRGDHDKPLIAAMRCYVASKMGDVAEIPDELC